MVKQLRPSHFWRKLSPNWRQVEFSSFSDLKRFPKKLLFTNSQLRRRYWLWRSYYRCCCCKLTIYVLLIIHCCVFFNAWVVLKTADSSQLTKRSVLWTRSCGYFNTCVVFLNTWVVSKTTGTSQVTTRGVWRTRRCVYLCDTGDSIYTDG